MQVEHCSRGRIFKVSKLWVQFFEYEELHENSKKFEIASRHAFWDQRKLFNEKTEVKKSCWTVPLSSNFVSLNFASSASTTYCIVLVCEITAGPSSLIVCTVTIC
jgi:hypothetical protein